MKINLFLVVLFCAIVAISCEDLAPPPKKEAPTPTDKVIQPDDVLFQAKKLSKDTHVIQAVEDIKAYINQ